MELCRGSIGTKPNGYRMCSLLLYHRRQGVIALTGLSRDKAISHQLIHVTATQKKILGWQRGGRVQVAPVFASVEITAAPCRDLQETESRCASYVFFRKPRTVLLEISDPWVRQSRMGFVCGINTLRGMDVVLRVIGALKPYR